MKNLKEIEGYPNYFITHSPPRVFRLVSGELVECKQTRNSKKDPYWTVTLREEGGRFVKRSVHRLLMLTFVPNPECKPQVNHIDGDKSNNNLDNLEWVTAKENVEHAVRMGLKDNKVSEKEVHQYNLSGDYLKSFPSCTIAGKETGIEATNIRACARGVRRVAGNYQWRYGDRKPKIGRVNIVKGYIFEGIEYKTLKEIAEKLGKSMPDKAGIRHFGKTERDKIKIVYLD